MRPRIIGNRADYVHGNLTEWWRALPVGFEQGFTIAKRPAGHGELTLTLTANTPAERHGETLVWNKLRYGGLVVTDANGKVIPSKLETQGKRVLIAVNDAEARYPLTVDPLVWLEQKVSASDGQAGYAFGQSVVLDGSTAVIGAPGATVNGNQYQGAAYVFSETGGIWSQTTKLAASDGTSGDEFGDAVALEGNTTVIGAYDATVGGNTWQGAAYVFKGSGGTWSQTAKLTASDGAAFNFFGDAVALDGGTVVVGADSAAVGGNSNQGAAYVFTESGDTWSQTAKLTASDGAASDYFGDSVALGGSAAMIGADGATVGGNASQGAAYVFTESGGTWSQSAKLTASDGVANDWFGNSVAFDGTTALIGARYETVGGNIDQGAAYVFGESGGTWSQTQKLTASDGAEFDDFGWSVALAGGAAVIGAWDATVGANDGQGAAYVFTKSGGAWSQTQKLVASDGAAYDQFGYSVALAGTTALVGAYDATVNGNDEQGAGYFYGQDNLDFAVSAPQTVGQGQTYVSQTIATNNATAASPAVSATVTVPAAASFVSASATQGSCSEASGVVTCDFGAISGNA
ncbi:MAG: FG-GAP repeat protein, partial [Gammaproteobacteria bacterium]